MKPQRGTGKEGVLRALEGRSPPRTPVLLYTWGFDYIWRVARIEPWRLACGDTRTWHDAYIALVDRHEPDAIIFCGPGSGPRPPTLVGEDDQNWIVRDDNLGGEYVLRKDGLSLTRRAHGSAQDDAGGPIETTDDAGRRIPEFTGYPPDHLGELARLIEDCGDRALVLPIHCPAYISACYAMGFERAMTSMLTEPALFDAVRRRFQHGERLRMRQLRSAGAEAVFISDSWASCDIISPRMFEEFALPCQRSVAEAARDEGLRVLLWTSGDIRPVLGLEAALPIDAFGFEQPRKSANLELREVRESFGPGRCLLGNLDSEHLLLRGDADEIGAAVRDQIESAGPGLPFVFSTGSPLPSDVSPDAVDLMIRAMRAAAPRSSA